PTLPTPCRARRGWRPEGLRGTRAPGPANRRDSVETIAEDRVGAAESGHDLGARTRRLHARIDRLADADRVRFVARDDAVEASSAVETVRKRRQLLHRAGMAVHLAEQARF